MAKAKEFLVIYRDGRDYTVIADRYEKRDSDETWRLFIGEREVGHYDQSDVSGIHEKAENTSK